MFIAMDYPISVMIVEVCWLKCMSVGACFVGDSCESFVVGYWRGWGWSEGYEREGIEEMV